MSIYDEMRVVAADLLSSEDFKQKTITLISIAPASGPDDDPGEPTETSYELSGTLGGVSYKYVRDGFAVASDYMVIAKIIDGVIPSINDFIEKDGVRYKIIQDVSTPAGDKVVWKFIVRK